MQLKTTKSKLTKMIREELKKIISEGGDGGGAALFAKYIAEDPINMALKAKMDPMKCDPFIEEIYYDDIKDSSDPNFKLVSVEIKVKSKL